MDFLFQNRGAGKRKVKPNHNMATLKNSDEFEVEDVEMESDSEISSDLEFDEKICTIKDVLDICKIRYSFKQLKKLENLLSNLSELRTCNENLDFKNVKETSKDGIEVLYKTPIITKPRTNVEKEKVRPDEKGKVLICNKCLECYDSPQTLEDHLNDLCQNGSITCECNEILENIHEVATHAPNCKGKPQTSPNGGFKPKNMQVKRKKSQKTSKEIRKTFFCEYCSRSNFQSEAKFENHRKSHQKKGKNQKTKPFSCSECKKSFHLQRQLDLHMKMQHTEHVCKTCDETFHGQFNWMSHNKNEHKKDKNTAMPFKCLQCEKTFRMKADLTLHVSIIHEQKSRKTCPECSKLFFESDLKDHLQNVHKCELVYL